MKVFFIVSTIALFFVSCKTSNSFLRDSQAEQKETDLLSTFNRATDFQNNQFDFVFQSQNEQLLGVWIRNDHYEAKRGTAEIDKIIWQTEILNFKDTTSNEQTQRACHQTGILENLKFHCFYISKNQTNIEISENILNQTDQTPNEIIWTKEENQQNILAITKDVYNRYDYLAQSPRTLETSSKPIGIGIKALNNGNYNASFAEVSPSGLNWIHDIELVYSTSISAGFNDLKHPIWKGCIKIKFKADECFVLKVKNQELIKLYLHKENSNNALSARIIKSEQQTIQ